MATASYSHLHEWERSKSVTPAVEHTIGFGGNAVGLNGPEMPCKGTQTHTHTLEERWSNESLSTTQHSRSAADAGCFMAAAAVVVGAFRRER